MANILVVEDDESMNSILVKTLTDQDHRVEPTFNTSQAIEACRKSPFDLVITDVRLPGKDGVEGLLEIKQLQPNIRCIVITGYASAETPARAIKLRVDDYLLKPFRLNTFLASVRRVLDPEGELEARLQLIKELVPQPVSPLSEEATQLIKERKQALRGLFVGSRSAFLSHEAACEIYVKIEMLEEKFRKTVALPSPERMSLTKVRVLYAAISDRIVSFHSGNADKDPESTIVLTAGQFTPLYQAMRSSAIGLNELDCAPLLRRIADKRLQAYPGLMELKNLIWPNLLPE